MFLSLLITEKYNYTLAVPGDTEEIEPQTLNSSMTRAHWHTMHLLMSILAKLNLRRPLGRFLVDTSGGGPGGSPQ